jgi:hypothetical protein
VGSSLGRVKPKTIKLVIAATHRALRVRAENALVGSEACPYNIFLVTDRSIYCHMTLSAMNYLLYISCAPSNVVQTNLASVFESYSIEQKATKQLLTAVPLNYN